ncbi:DUF3408 domain-containing protein [Parapedobacter sp. 10938]|uniref:DUF3408 domain-containing protein n=1 Tax=Parapedobacter flavus TaxID=3110225 RepID=UPI002DBF6AF1|nr:DUF3408 domain-containing protein [Parapedobacter sp. 10938]MEC3880250.1 DUF3408 domain-containing protein [Parapedobacter sp. 10938]
MEPENTNNDFKKPNVDEDYLMNIISGDEPAASSGDDKPQAAPREKTKPKDTSRRSASKKTGYEELFLVNRLPSGRNGKVVYIRPEYHERLLRIVQLTKKERTTLYAYIDNILEHHFREFGEDITDYFNKHFKPIL